MTRKDNTMKKLLPLLSLILLLTACGNKPASGDNSSDSASLNEKIEYSADAIDMKTATESYKSDFEACKAAGYPNLSFDKTEAYPVETVEKCRKLEEASYNQRKEEIEGLLTQKEKVEKLKEYCEFFLGEYDEKWAGFDSVDGNDTFEPLEVDGFRYTMYEKLAGHMEEIENEDQHIYSLIYIDPYKRNYLWYIASSMKYPYEFNKGNAAEILKKSGKGSLGIQYGVTESAWDVPPAARYYNDGTNNDVTYRLADGDCSIGEAIEYFTNDFQSSLPFDEEDKQQYLVRYIDVFPMTDDTYAYFIRFSPIINSRIPFERFVSKGSVGVSVTGTGIGGSFSAGLPDEYCVSSQALMIKKNDIDVSRGFDPIYGMNEVGGEITKIIPLKKAVDTVSERLTQQVTFEVVEIDLVYHGTEARDLDTSTVLKPTWLIRMFNPNDDCYYIAYADAVTGEVSIYNYIV